MAFYKETVPNDQMFDTIIQRLTTAPAGAQTPFWTQVQTGPVTEGIVLYSKGKTGTDDIWVRMKNKTTVSWPHIEISVIEKYVPNSVSTLAGTATNEIIHLAYYVPQSSYGTIQPIGFWLSFDKNKIMLRIEPDRSYGWNTKHFVWVGMPDRLSPETDNGACCIAGSAYAGLLFGQTWSYEFNNYGFIKILRDRAKAAPSYGKLRTLSGITKSKGWGDFILLPDYYVTEHYVSGDLIGPRFRLDGVKPIRQTVEFRDFRDGDEISQGSKRYTIFKVKDNNDIPETYTNCFTHDYIAVEQL